MYRNLYDHNFFLAGAAGISPTEPVQKASSVSTRQQ
jgi:hypothetical protein